MLKLPNGIPVIIYMLFAGMFMFAFVGSMKAQEASGTSPTSQLWVDFNPKYKISDQYYVGGKLGSKVIFPTEWYKMYFTVEGGYMIPPFMLKKLKYSEKVYVGVDFYYVFVKDNPDIVEVSPYQGYTLSWPNRERIIVRHNAELGQRFQWSTGGGGNSFGLKVSYEASLIVRLQGDLWRYGKGFYFSASAKFWWNLISTNVFNDVVRITPGIGYQINPSWKTFFSVGYNYTRDQTIDDFQRNNIIYRLRIYHYF